MRYPERLHKGGTIGCIAPSFGCATEPYRSLFLQAQTTLKSKGYKIWLGPNCYKTEGIGKSNTPEACAKEVMSAFTNPDIDVILSCGGGELMCEDLPLIDFHTLKHAEPKWFMGLSDNTNLTFLLPVLADTAAIYGPCAGSFGMKPWHASIDDAWKLLRGKIKEVGTYDAWERESAKTEDDPFAPYNLTEPEIPLAYLPGEGNLVQTQDRLKYKGRLLGGCLDILAMLCGTRYDAVARFNQKYREDGTLWFLEACDLNPMGIRRAMFQLEEAGWFDTATGFLIGRSYCGEEPMMGLTAREAYLGILEHHHVPVIMDVDIGHLPPVMPIVTGAVAGVTYKDNSVRIKYEFK